jgi:hypothetical protein
MDSVTYIRFRLISSIFTVKLSALNYMINKVLSPDTKLGNIKQKDTGQVSNKRAFLEGFFTTSTVPFGDHFM